MRGVLILVDVNSILYENLIQVLKEKDERIENDLFKAILSACRMSVGENGITVLSASGLAGMGAVATHYERTELSPYVREVCKRSNIEVKKVTDKIERAKIKIEKYKETKAMLKSILKDDSSEGILVNREDLKILLSPPK